MKREGDGVDVLKKTMIKSENDHFVVASLSLSRVRTSAEEGTRAITVAPAKACSIPIASRVGSIA